MDINQEELIKRVLWSLAALRSEIALVRLDLVKLQHPDAPQTNGAEFVKSQKMAQVARLKIFEDDTKACGLENATAPAKQEEFFGDDPKWIG